MIVTLSNEAESYVEKVMSQLSAGPADEVVNWLLLKQRADDAYDLDYPPPTEAGLVQKLLEAVRAPHRTYEPGEFRRNAEQLIAERQAS